MNSISRLRRSKGHAALSTEEIVERVIAPKVECKTEGELQFECVNALRGLGLFVNASANGIKCSPRQMSMMKSRGLVVGFPDLQVIKPGRVIFIELKTPRGVVSVPQIMTHAALRALGYEVHVCTSVDEVLAVCA